MAKTTKKFNYKDIKTFEDACAATSINPETLPDVSMLPQDVGDYLVSIYKLTVIVTALNNGWKANSSDHSSWKCYPYFYVSSAGGFSFCDCTLSHTFTLVGARLCYQSEELAIYAGKQFIDLYEKIQVMPV